MSKETRPIIVVKKVVKGNAHHGGQWKVAFADFMTAMMAFFLVMWIVGMDDGVKQAIEGYFQNPAGFQNGQAGMMSPLTLGGAQASPNSVLPLHVMTRQFEEQRYRQIGQKIETTLGTAEEMGEIAAQVEVVLTDDGLRIELVEGEDGDTFFSLGAANLTPAAERALQIIARELGAASAPIVVEGHTDAAQYSVATGYTNWELSADRANAARRTMERSGLGVNRVAEIRGHADRHLRVQENPYDNANRRISILLPFTTQPIGDLAGSEGAS